MGAYTHPTSRQAIADLVTGMRSETGSLAALTYLDSSGTPQHELWTVTGRIMVLQLYLEVTSLLGTGASQVLFNCTFTTPSIVANPMCGKCASISDGAQGLRIVWKGGAVATAAVITDSAGLSDVICTSPQIVGGEGFVGSIGMLTSDASITTGTLVGVIHWIPMSATANVVAAV